MLNVTEIASADVCVGIRSTATAAIARRLEPGLAETTAGERQLVGLIDEWVRRGVDVRAGPDGSLLVDGMAGY